MVVTPWQRLDDAVLVHRAHAGLARELFELAHAGVAHDQRDADRRSSPGTP